VGRDLDHRLQQLRLDPPLVRRRLRDLVEARDELEALLVEQLELLLDAEAEGRALAVVVFYALRHRLRCGFQDAGLGPVSV
jgi:hypothetical protein